MYYQNTLLFSNDKLHKIICVRFSQCQEFSSLQFTFYMEFINSLNAPQLHVNVKLHHTIVWLHDQFSCSFDQGPNKKYEEQTKEECFKENYLQSYYLQMCGCNN